MPNGELRYRFAGFVLDVGERTLHADGRHVYLPPKTFETLRFLVERPGHLVTKTELLDAVWPGVAVTENALTRCIKEVRAALDDDVHAPRCIETVPRVGYRFIAPVETLPTAIGHAGPGADVLAGQGTPGGPPTRGWPHRAGLLVVFAGLLVLVPVGSFLATPPDGAPAVGPREFVLVADVENQTNEPDLDRPLHSAFLSLVEQSPHANVYPRTLVAATLQRMGRGPGARLDETTAREVCLREGIRGLITLTVTRVGHRYSMNARLVAPDTGITVTGRTAVADGRDELLDAVSEVASELRRTLGESLDALETGDHALERVTTPSLKALQAYSDGQALWERGEHAAAVRLYHEAVDADPDFAQAHAALGAAYYSHVYGDRARGDHHFTKALRLSHRTTDRERRGIEASWAQHRGHWLAAEELYRAYLQRYPDDFKAKLQLASVLRQLARFDQAIQHYQDALRAAPNHASAHVNLATCFTPLGRYAEALRHYEAAFALEPGWRTSGNLAHEYGFALVRAGQPARARQHFNGLLSTGTRASALRSLALVDMLEGRYHDARARLEEAATASMANGPSATGARNLLLLAMAEAALGRPAAARDQVAHAAGVARASQANPWLLSRIGVEAARLGARDQAASLLGDVTRHTDDDSAEQVADLRRLEGEVALARGDRRRAIERLTLADHARRSAFTVGSLARAHAAAGHAPEATALFEQLLAMEPIALGFEPQQDWLEAHLRLARLRLEAGNAAGAAEVAGALLSRWREADAECPLVRDLHALHAHIAGGGRRPAR